VVVSATSVKLLQTAAEIVGGNDELAKRLGISERALAIFLADRRAIPDALLLRAVDIILEDRPPFSSSARPAAGLPSKSIRDG
jgi:hypothetical protein